MLGRFCTLWAVCAAKDHWTEATYDWIFQACVAIPNVHIRRNPLHEDEYLDHSNYQKRMDEIRRERVATREQAMAKYRKQRQGRVNQLLPSNESLSERNPPRSSVLYSDSGDEEYGQYCVQTGLHLPRK